MNTFPPSGRIAAISLIWLMGVVFAAMAHARTITVVYDDSGSMKTSERWSYASYSIQVLRALLRPTDELNVVYMNQPGVARYSGEATQQDIDTIVGRANHTGRVTPYASVRQAIEAVAASGDRDTWLLVITDGEFEDLPKERAALESLLQAEIREFRSRLPETRTAFLGIGQKPGSNPVFETWRANAGSDLFYAETVDQIIPTMAAIGARLTSLGAGGESLRLEMSGREIAFTPRFPLRRLVVMQQSASPDTATSLESARAGERRLQLSLQSRARAPGNQVRAAASIVHLATADSAALPAGVPVTFTLSGPILPGSRFNLFPDVDARLETSFTDDRGKPLQLDGGTLLLCAGRSLRARASLVFPSAPTGVTLDTTGARITLRTGTQEVPMQAVSGGFEAQVRLGAGEHPVSTTGSMTGYFHLQRNGLVRVVDCPPREITLRAGPKGDVGDPPRAWQFPVTDLAEAPPLEIVPFIDGRQASAEEFQALRMRFDLGGLVAEPATLERSWEISPHLRWRSPAFTPVGDFKVGLKLDGTLPEDRVRIPESLLVQVGDPGLLARFGPLLGKLLAAIAALIYLYGIVTKPRFSDGTKVERRSMGSIQSAYPPQSLAKWLGRLVPFIPEKLSPSDIPFFAYRRNEILIPARAVKNDWNPQPRKKGDPLILRTNQSLEIPSGSGKIVYTYSSSSGSAASGRRGR